MTKGLTLLLDGQQVNKKPKGKMAPKKHNQNAAKQPAETGNLTKLEAMAFWPQNDRASGHTSRKVSVKITGMATSLTLTSLPLYPCGSALLDLQPIF